MAPSERLSSAISTGGHRASLEGLMRLRQGASFDGATSRRKVHSHLFGGYASAFRGRGIDFDEVRIYQPGDDIRAVDWRVTARTGIPHTKLYREERERPVLLMVDQCRDMFFGTRRAFKSVAAVEAAAWLAWAALDHGDRIGATIFSEQAHFELPPAAGRRGMTRLLNALLKANGALPTAAGKGETPFGHAVARMQAVARPGSLLFVISDFRQMDSRAQTGLAQLARHNDVVAVFVSDPLEASLPPPGSYTISDGRRRAVLRSGAEADARHRARFEERRTKLESFCRKQGIFHLSLSTHQDVSASLSAGLRRRGA